MRAFLSSVISWIGAYGVEGATKGRDQPLSSSARCVGLTVLEFELEGNNSSGFGRIEEIERDERILLREGDGEREREVLHRHAVLRGW